MNKINTFLEMLAKANEQRLCWDRLYRQGIWVGIFNLLIGLTNLTHMWYFALINFVCALILFLGSRASSRREKFWQIAAHEVEAVLKSNTEDQVHLHMDQLHAHFNTKP